MSFKYINPGYAELLTDKSCKTVMNETYNPKNKVCFSPGYKNSDYDNRILVPYKPSEIYGLFYVTFTAREYYYTSNYGIMFQYSYSSQRSGLQFYNNSAYDNYINVRMLYDNSVSTNAQISNYAQTKPYKIWFHIRMKTTESDENGLIEFSIDGGKTIAQEFNSVATFYNRLLVLKLCNTAYFSNLIISDEYINPKEEIILLPISSNETDMTFDSDTGIYTATAANQTILQSVDVSSLSNDYGSDSAVTGIALIGNPAYKTANGLTSLTAQSKENNVITDIETISLEEDTSAMILASQKISDKTIADLQNIQFGWKAGA